MRPIPKKLREEIARDPFMKTCIRRNEECSGRIEWEHAFTYAGKQINEAWAIVPVCVYHHRGLGLDKEYNQYRAIIRADIEDLCKRMPNKDWRQIKNYLVGKYEKSKMVINQ